MTKPMMKCGHAANASSGGRPCCVICYPNPKSREVEESGPDLSGRKARCSYYRGGCKSEKPSSTDLAFFEYLGPGSESATRICKRCGFHQSAHERGATSSCSVDKFEPQSDLGFDIYYCGCFGWD